MNEIAAEKVKASERVQIPKISRDTRPGMDVTRILYPPHQEIHLSMRPIPGEKPLEMVSRLTGLLKAYGATVVRHEIFGSLAIHGETMQALQHEVEEFDWPITWIEGRTTLVPAISGMHIFAVAGTQVETICQNGRPVGRIFSDGCFKHCLLGGINSSKHHASKADQCRDVL